MPQGVLGWFARRRTPGQRRRRCADREARRARRRRCRAHAGGERALAGRARRAQGVSRRAGAGRRRHRGAPRRDPRAARPERLGQVDVHQCRQRPLPARRRRDPVRGAGPRAGSTRTRSRAPASRGPTRSRGRSRTSPCATTSRCRRCSARASAVAPRGASARRGAGSSSRASRPRPHALPDDLNLHQRKFLELARALASRPRLLLLDEVLSGLTPGEINGAVDLIRAIRDQGATIVFVEHVMRAVHGAGRPHRRAQPRPGDRRRAPPPTSWRGPTSSPRTWEPRHA